MGLTDPSRTLQVPVGPFGAGNLTFTFSVGFHPRLLVELPCGELMRSRKLDSSIPSDIICGALYRTNPRPLDLKRHSGDPMGTEN